MSDLQAFDRQMEKDGYWLSGSGYGCGYAYMGGATAAWPAPNSGQHEERFTHTQEDDDDPHLRSIAAVTGYHNRAIYKRSDQAQ